jgi:hypothetical protein
MQSQLTPAERRKLIDAPFPDIRYHGGMTWTGCSLDSFKRMVTAAAHSGRQHTPWLWDENNAGHRDMADLEEQS